MWWNNHRYHKRKPYILAFSRNLNKSISPVNACIWKGNRWMDRRTDGWNRVFQYPRSSKSQLQSLVMETEFLVYLRYYWLNDRLKQKTKQWLRVESLSVCRFVTQVRAPEYMFGELFILLKNLFKFYFCNFSQQLK